ncbi:MAG: hypothetical protein VX527_05330 [Planctomycetota bacterium]|nr:hypothetical protein [Planctomycetota bacterium]
MKNRTLIIHLILASFLAAPTVSLAQRQQKVPPAAAPPPISRAVPITQATTPVEEAPASESDAPEKDAEASDKMAPAEAERLVTLYEALPPDEQEQMRLLYETQDVDLLAMVTLVRGGDEEKQPLLPVVGRKQFKRTPASVLAARTKLGLEESDRPADDASPKELAEWLHLNVMAGEWGQLQWFLAERAGDEGEGIYSHIIQSTNKGDPMLLPEEVLALANAAPEGDEENPSPTNWQVDVLGKLLKRASQRSSMGPMLAQLREGTRLFGGTNPDNQARTAAMLTRAGLSDEAYQYMPSLDDAREAGNGRVLLVHGLYHAEREESIPAWELFGEVSLIEEEEFELRQEALREAVKRLPEVPEAQGTEWLTRVFANEQLAPAALEIIALDAMALGESELSDADRARAILVMKSAVDTLLESERVDSNVIRVPLRMLTTGLVAEAESAAKAAPAKRGPQQGLSTLMRAFPDETWLDSIEPSLAARTYRAFTGVATRADEIDTAMEILEQGVNKHPEDAAAMGEEFLAMWVKRLRPDQGSNRDAATRYMFMIYGGDSSMTAAPLTRGRQARNLDRLVRVLALLEARGVESRAVPGVVDAFQACHSRSEAYTEEDIVRVLGPLEELPPETAAQLAKAMQSGLSGDWRSREVQQRFGMRRNATEIAIVVEDGYALALRLIDRAREMEPDSWEHAISKAALAYERLEHRRSQTGEELADYEQLRDESFEAFRDAAIAYADSAGRGEVEASPFVFQAWFNVAIGATNLAEVTRDNVLYEGSERDTQIELIRETIHQMPPALAEEHMDLLANALTDSIDSISAEVKPRVVRHALRVIGDHPSGAALRRINDLYSDLVEDEIHLRLALDGADRVGTGEPFGAVLTLRYTNAVDRETDGFGKYLQNDVWVYMGNRGTTMNYRDRLERSIRDALSEGFEIDGVGFFESMYPSREVMEDGQTGWQEKPLAYIVLKATDPSIERIPSVAMDLDFMDQTGPVILPIESNAPLIDASTASDARPMHDLTIEQIVDVRNADEEVVLEITANGRGVVADLETLMSGLHDALPGYAIAESGIETHPVSMIEAAPEETDFFFWGEEEEKEFAGADEDGIHRQNIERTWTVRYVPTAAASTGDFTLPILANGIPGNLVSRTYSDMDLVPVEGASVPLTEGIRTWMWILIGVIIIVLVVAVLALVGRRDQDVEGHSDLERLLPARPTPLSAVAALERIDLEFGSHLAPDRRAKLQSEIRDLHERFFGPTGETPNGQLQQLVEAWAREALAAS